MNRRMGMFVLASAAVLFCAYLLAAPTGCSVTRFSPTITPSSCKLHVSIQPCTVPGKVVHVYVDAASVYYGAPATAVDLTFDISAGHQHDVSWRVTDTAVPPTVYEDTGIVGFSDTSKSPCMDVTVPSCK